MEKESKKLGLFNLLTMNIGIALGSGVFTLLTSVIGFAGRSICFAVLIGSVLGLLISLPSAFLSSTINLTGGEYTRGLALMPLWLAGINGVIKLVSPFGYAVYLLGMASYTLQLIPEVNGLYKAVAFLYLVLFFLFGIKGSKSSARVQDIMVIFLLIALGIYLFGGLPRIQPGYFEADGFFSGGVSGFMYATAMLSMGATGGSGIISFASVTKNPKRNIPLALILGAVIVTGVYFLVSIVAAGIVPIDLVHGANLGVVAGTFLSKPLFIFFIIGGAIFALGASVNGVLSTFQFPWDTMIKDGWFPKVLGKREKKFNYPYILMGIFFVVGGVLPILFDLDIATVSTLFSFPNFAFNAGLALATLRLPKLYPNRWRNSPLYLPKPIFVCLILFSCASGVFVTVSFIQNLNRVLIIGMCIVLILVCAYVLWRYKAGYVHVDSDYIKEIRDIPDSDYPV